MSVFKTGLFRGLHKLRPRPDWSLLGVKFKISDEHPHPFHIEVPPPPPPPWVILLPATVWGKECGLTKLLEIEPILTYAIHYFTVIKDMKSLTQPDEWLTFNKRGLTPNEFEDCLSSKIDKHFKELNTDENIGSMKLSTDKINELMKTCIINLKANIMNVSSNNILENMFNYSNKSDERITQYHENHYHLFQKLLIPKFRNVFPDNVILKNDRKGYFFWRDRLDNNNRLTPEEYSNVIDQITTEYIKYFSQLMPNTENPDHDNNQKRAELEDEYVYCMLVLIDILDWSKENNLMDIDGNNEWKRFVLVVISYTALAVVLDMILSMFDKGWKPSCYRFVTYV